jgi:hypothetical protein
MLINLLCSSLKFDSSEFLQSEYKVSFLVKICIQEKRKYSLKIMVRLNRLHSLAYWLFGPCHVCKLTFKLNYYANMYIDFWHINFSVLEVFFFFFLLFFYHRIHKDNSYIFLSQYKFDTVG